MWTHAILDVNYLDIILYNWLTLYTTQFHTQITRTGAGLRYSLFPNYWVGCGPKLLVSSDEHGLKLDLNTTRSPHSIIRPRIVEDSDERATGGMMRDRIILIGIADDTVDSLLNIQPYFQTLPMYKYAEETTCSKGRGPRELFWTTSSVVVALSRYVYSTNCWIRFFSWVWRGLKTKTMIPREIIGQTWWSGTKTNIGQWNSSPRVDHFSRITLSYNYHGRRSIRPQKARFIPDTTYTRIPRNIRPRCTCPQEQWCEQNGSRWCVVSFHDLWLESNSDFGI